eukprot:CAMPEP_0172535690 /NCGR_PEP_ID=MMETSP1067-20121228/7582_1 /TAXON_ID=265564 ORGANISM="Thalassiosira punctigera, Strain Tpunct2005C2" /NCGR_SAMPLE_ID=MMETSP1067 /ASSEMBLY_ACC=CAM_ASM_000444 /LENGTH=543 /DNA_ID=CAMNT_0013320631 /DNA_START=244 /DNA_END=1872 /DNA_ORIENTATION=-
MAIFKAGSAGNGLLTLVMCATCVMVGYIVGSTKSNMSEVGNLSGHAESKVEAHHLHKYHGVENDTEFKAGAYYSHRYHRGGNDTDAVVLSTTEDRKHPKASPSVVEEIIPPNLLPSYAPDKLLFPVTRSMLRQSRPVVGDTERLHAYLKKLRSRTCTFILFMGGSVSAGHNGGGPTNAYPKHFTDWLNEKYPCNLADGTQGKHEYMKTHAGESKANFAFWSGVTSVEKIDMIVLEFNVGDAFQSTLPHALEDKGEAGNTKEYIQCWYFEAVLRRLLLLRKPDPVAIITFNADYMGSPWSNRERARKILFKQDVEPQTLFVSSMYGIPVFSAVIWMLPMAGKRGFDLQFNRTVPYSTSNWHSDSCCHPRKQGGHHVLSLVMAYCMVEEEKVFLSHNESDTVEAERDFTLDAIPLLRDPLYLSPEEDDVYVRNHTFNGIDFSDPNGEAEWKKHLVANEGWTWYADNKDKDKFGFIANGTHGGQHIAVSLRGEQHGKVEVIYVVSYENFGTALAWFDESNENDYEQTFCKGEARRQMPVQQLEAIW